MKIAASISNSLPDGVSLMLQFGSAKGKSAGFVDLSNAVVPVTVVSGISKGVERSQSLTYLFAADAEAGLLESATRVVTLTVSD